MKPAARVAGPAAIATFVPVSVVAEVRRPRRNGRNGSLRLQVGNSLTWRSRGVQRRRSVIRTLKPSIRSTFRKGRIVLLTFASGRRRAEIAALNVEDLDFGRPGFLIVTIRKSKTDQGGAGQFVAVPRLETGPCAVAAIEVWLSIRELKEGPLFVAFSPHGELRETRIKGRLVAEVVKRLFRDAGTPASDIENIGAHSLRRGFITSADIGRAAHQICVLTRDSRRLTSPEPTSIASLTRQNR
jgi:integrase